MRQRKNPLVCLVQTSVQGALEIYHHDLGSRDKAGAERGLLRTEGDNYCRELLDHDFTGTQPIYNCEDNTVNPHHELNVTTPLV